MAFVHGKEGYLEIDVSGSPTDISAYVTSVDGFPGDVASHEVTTFGKDTVARSAGLKDTKVTVNGIYDATVDGYLAAILGTASTLSYGPSGNAGQKYTGEFLLSSYKVSDPVGGMSTWTANFEIASGDLSDSAW